MYSIITIAYIYHKKVFCFSSVLFISLYFILMYIARRMCVINKKWCFYRIGIVNNVHFIYALLGHYTKLFLYLKKKSEMCPNSLELNLGYSRLRMFASVRNTLLLCCSYVYFLGWQCKGPFDFLLFACLAQLYNAQCCVGYTLSPAD